MTEVSLKELHTLAKEKKIDLRVDPALSLNNKLEELQGAHFYILMYPVFDGTLVPYISLDFRKKGTAHFHFDYEDFKKNEPHLASLFQNSFRGIPFKLIFLGA